MNTELHGEIRGLIRSDPTRTGEVFSLLSEGLTDAEVQVRLDLATMGSIGHAKRDVRAVLELWNPPGFGPALRALNLVRRLGRQSNISEHARSFLVAREQELSRWLDGLKEFEEQRVASAISRESHPALGGVYVWSIATYLELERNGLAWFRIGQSADIESRMNQHRANIKLPEPLLHLRSYTSDHLAPDALEANFHRIVQSATHSRARVNDRDREWFLTSLEFLDQYALDIGCVIHEFGEV